LFGGEDETKLKFCFDQLKEHTFLPQGAKFQASSYKTDRVIRTFAQNRQAKISFRENEFENQAKSWQNGLNFSCFYLKMIKLHICNLAMEIMISSPSLSYEAVVSEPFYSLMFLPLDVAYLQGAPSTSDFRTNVFAQIF
jgi:hypothetical protein